MIRGFKCMLGFFFVVHVNRFGFGYKPSVHQPFVKRFARVAAGAETSTSAIIPGLQQVKHIIAVSSCKGGVGKSTVAVNLAYSLRNAGASVGIWDADIFGPSLPTMTSPQRSNPVADNRIIPLEYEGVKLLSLGFLNTGAAIMRGPMVNQVLSQFVQRAEWGSLDYLILDLPPGTGDIQLTLAQSMNISAAVIVTTPQKLSFVDVVKGIDMFDTVNIPCIAVVENLTEFQTYEFDNAFYTNLSQQLVSMASENDGGKQHQVAETLKGAIEAQRRRKRIFGPGHTARLTEMWGIENIVSLPVLEELSRSGDSGVPYVLAHPDSSFTRSMDTLAAGVEQELRRLAQRDASQRDENTLFFDRLTAMMSVGPLQEGDGGSSVSALDLRCSCRCAACIEELTGRALLDRDSVSLLVQPVISVGDTPGSSTTTDSSKSRTSRVAVGAPIGRYAVAVDWSDGHKSLYPFKQLRKLMQTASMQEAPVPILLDVAKPQAV